MFSLYINSEIFGEENPPDTNHLEIEQKFYSLTDRVQVVKPSIPSQQCVIPLGVMDNLCPIAEATSIVLYCHGNKGSLFTTDTLNNLVQLRVLFNCPAISFDYPGRGHYAKEHGVTSQVSAQTTNLERMHRFWNGVDEHQVFPSEEWAVASAVAVLTYILERFPRIQNVFVWGMSLGSAVACELVVSAFFNPLTKGKIRALILQSPIAQGILLSEGLKPMWVDCLGIKIDPGLDNIKAIKEYPDAKWPCPVLLVHGLLDSDIPYAHAELVEKALREKNDSPVELIILPEKNHRNIKINELDRAVKEWFRRAVSLNQPLATRGEVVMGMIQQSFKSFTTGSITKE